MWLEDLMEKMEIHRLNTSKTISILPEKVKREKEVVWSRVKEDFHFKRDLSILKRMDVYNGLLDSEGEGEGGMIWENGNSNMYTIM